MGRAVFGIDFGTTNTRIVFYNGRELIPIPAKKGKEVYNIPSVVGYVRGKPVAFGHEALKRKDVKLVKSIKWRLTENQRIDVDGGRVETIQVVADFFKFLQDVVRKSDIPGVPNLTKISLSVPVKYSENDRQNLCKACEMAGIEVGSIFYEPVAALYSDDTSYEKPGVKAVFDWGGGTLDTAVVNFDSEYAKVKSVNGIERGGDDFDRIILEKALSHFESEIIETSKLPKSLIEERIEDFRQDTDLLRLAENAKIKLSDSDEITLSRVGLLSDSLSYPFTRNMFELWIEADIENAIKCLKECISESGFKSFDHLVISGGTCNIPEVQVRLKHEFRLDRVSSPQGDDAGMGTAKGTALLAAHGGEPVFAKDIGIRMDEGTDEENFYPLYEKNRLVNVNNKQISSLIFTDATEGQSKVYMKICDRDSKWDKRGRAMDIVPIPIDKEKTSFRIKYWIDEYLVMKVEILGIPLIKDSKERFIPDIPLAFKIPK